MRIDKFLKVSRIIKRRTVAKDACDQGRVKINGLVVKAGDAVKVNDNVSIEFGNRIQEFKILDIKEHVKKDEATNMFEVIS